MNPAALVLELRRRGARLIVRDGRPVCQAPRGAVTPELVAAFRGGKSIILAILRAEEANCPIPVRTCRAVCNGQHTVFWFSVHGSWACSSCHPPGSPDLVLVEHGVAVGVKTGITSPPAGPGATRGFEGARGPWVALRAGQEPATGGAPHGSDDLEVNGAGGNNSELQVGGM